MPYRNDNPATQPAPEDPAIAGDIKTGIPSDWTPSPPPPGPEGFKPPPYPSAVTATSSYWAKDQDAQDRAAAQHDSDVAQKWANYQHDVLGLAPEARTTLPPSSIYTPASEVVANGRPGGGRPFGGAFATLNQDEPTPDEIVSGGGLPEPTGQPGGRDANRALDASGAADQGPMQAPSATAAPRQGGGGGGGGVPGHDFAAQLGEDYDALARGHHAEADARAAYAAEVSAALGHAADTQQAQGESAISEAHARGDAARAKIAEIEQLNRDYANEKIDPHKWWSDMNVPQKIFTVIGSMFAGGAGGPAGASSFVDSLVNRSISIQQAQIEQHYKSGIEAHNLLASFMRTSDNEAEAVSKARAAMYGAAMLHVQQAGVSATSPIQQAQIRQTLATLKLQKDMSAAQASAKQGQAGAGALQGGWLEANPEDTINVDGQDYHLEKGAEDVRTRLDSLGQLASALQTGQGTVDERSMLDRGAGLVGAGQWDKNISEGQTAHGEALAAFTAIVGRGGRGLNPGLISAFKQAIPDYGSSTVDKGVSAAQTAKALQLVDEMKASILNSHGAKPVEVRNGPGQGKNASKLTTYVRFGPQRVQQQRPVRNDAWKSFQPQ